MRRKRNISRSSRLSTEKPSRLELHPDRAFVVHLDLHAQLPRRVVGRVEHVTSGQVTHIASLGELMGFMAKVLRNEVRDERGRASADLVHEALKRDRVERARSP
jgi:hypothetical protein